MKKLIISGIGVIMLLLGCGHDCWYEKYEVLEEGPWSYIDNPAKKTLRSMYGLSANNIWAVGDKGAIVHYNGSSWQKVTSPVTADLNSVFFTSRNSGWAVGNSGNTGYLLHYNGTEWQINRTFIDTTLHAIHFTSQNEGWMVVCSWKVFLLHLQGGNWEVDTSTLEGADVQNIQAKFSFILENQGYVMVKPNVYSYNGNSWKYFCKNVESDIWFFSSTDGWLINIGKTDIYHWDGASFELFQNERGVSDHRAFYFLSPQSGWCVGRNAIYWQGREWVFKGATCSYKCKQCGDIMEQGQIYPMDINDIYAPSSGEAWAVGGRIWHYKE